MPSWRDLELLDDDDLVDAFLTASLPELSGEREGTIEVLRERFVHVARRAARARGLSGAPELDFLDWFWDHERLLRCISKYRAEGRSGFEAWLGKQARWQVLSFLRYRKRRRAEQLPGGDPPERDTDGPTLDDREEIETAVARVRACVAELPLWRRIPFKLVYLAQLPLTDAEVEAIAARGVCSVAGLRAFLAGLGGERPSHAEIGRIVGKNAPAIGQAVKRAGDDIARRLGGGGS